MKKWIKYLDLFVLFLASLALIFYVMNKYPASSDETKECVPVNLAPSFSYESCYDAYSKTIFLGIKRGQDRYNLKNIRIAFFDFFDREHALEEIPEVGGEKKYKIPAEKNPRGIDVYLDVSKNELDGPVCETPRRISVNYCSEAVAPKESEMEFNPLKGFIYGEFLEIKDEEKKSDLFALSLVEREKIWSSHCVSNWSCSEWGPCEDGVQKRKCRDDNKCFIPTSLPRVSQYCGDGCVESWECVWSECVGGFTTPNCYDKNDCGTTYDSPQKLKCSVSGCKPKIECSEWGPCEVNYNFENLINANVWEIESVKRRICRDKNSCAQSVEETKECVVGVDIYTKSFEKCGADFVGIYDLLDDRLIARIELGTEKNPYLNVFFDEKEGPYCDHCFDGVLNGDEEKIDCGGSCMPCREKYK